MQLFGQMPVNSPSESHAGKLSLTNMEHVMESLTRAAAGLQHTWHSETSSENYNMGIYLNRLIITSKQEDEKAIYAIKLHKFYHKKAPLYIVYV